MDIKKYIIPLMIGAFGAGSFLMISDYLISFDIMVKTVMMNNIYFKVFSGALFGAFCFWIVVYNKK